MNKTLIKNSWFLSGLLIVISMMFGLIILSVVEFLDIGNSGLSEIVGIVGAMFIGMIYATHFK